MKKRFMLMLTYLFLTGIGIAMAQVQKVSGTVTSDEDGEPIVGASVMVKGTTLGTITDLDGNFVLTNVPATAKMLVVSFIGMQTQEVAVKPTVKVVLKPDAKQLDEVMVVAYGTTKKTSFSGSASTMRGDKLQKMQVSNISKSLDGSIAGVQTMSTSGTPGASSRILIRGIGSVSSSQSPLIVVDGVPYEGSLNSISPQDIESLTVLKDAAANSMYGARGANGVIIITTKGSKSGKAKVNFEARYGMNTRGVQPYDVITDPGQFYEASFTAYRNSLVNDKVNMEAASEQAAKNLISEVWKYNVFKGVADGELIDPKTGKLNPKATERLWADDWSKDPFSPGARQEYNVNVSGGTEQTQAYASFGILSDKGYVVNSGFERINARVKVDQKIGEAVRIGANIAYANTQFREFGSANNGNYANIFMFSQRIAPIFPIYRYDENGQRLKDENGKDLYDFGTEKARPYSQESNPLASAKENLKRLETDNLSTRGYFEVKFLKDFKFTANLAFDVFSNRNKEFTVPGFGDAKSVGGRGVQTSTRRGTMNLNQLLNWDRSFGNHHVSALLGHETKQDRYESLYGHMTKFADPKNPDFANAATYQYLNSSTETYSLEGYFMRGEYNYADRYYFTASLRYDGSSRFAKESRWGSFWAIGGSWRMKEEAFLKDVQAIHNLKVKASYGTQGNDNILDQNGNEVWRAYVDEYEVKRVDKAPALSKTFRGNRELTWEKSNNFNAGIELGLWNRLNINADFFIKETKDLLYASPLSPSEGKPSVVYRNEMDMRNTGVELEISADIIKRPNLHWNVSLNATHYKNELTRLPVSKQGGDFKDGYPAGSYWRKLGGSLYDHYNYIYGGVDHEGRPLFKSTKKDAKGEKVKDKDGNYIIVWETETNKADRWQLGKSAIPDLTGGISTTLNAYGFDLSIQTAFQLGGYVYDTQYAELMHSGEQGGNFHKDRLNSWTEANKGQDLSKLAINKTSYEAGAGREGSKALPKLMYESTQHSPSGDFFYTSASYFSLRNVTLGYTMPTTWMKKIKAERMRVYLAGDNIWLLSKRRGLDPRQTISGSTSYVYSVLSTYSVGLNLTF